MAFDTYANIHRDSPMARRRQTHTEPNTRLNPALVPIHFISLLAQSLLIRPRKLLHRLELVLGYDILQPFYAHDCRGSVDPCCLEVDCVCAGCVSGNAHMK
jgi:hypothetical protein